MNWILLTISLVLNSCLIMYVVGITEFFLFISVVANIFAVFYIKYLFSETEEINNDMEDILDLVSRYTEHVSSLYQLETFYGDETLQSLVEHSQNVSDEMLSYCEKYEIIEIENDDIEEEIIYEEEEE